MRRRQLTLERLECRRVFAAPQMFTHRLPDGVEWQDSAESPNIGVYRAVGILNNSVVGVSGGIELLRSDNSALLEESYPLREGEQIEAIIELFADGRLYGITSEGGVYWSRPGVMPQTLALQGELIDVFGGGATKLSFDGLNYQLEGQINASLPTSFFESHASCEVGGSIYVLGYNEEFEPAVVKVAGSQPSNVVLARPSSLASDEPFGGEAVGCIVTTDSPDPKILAWYLRESGPDNLYQVGLWNGQSGEYLGDVSQDAYPQAFTSGATALIPRFDDGYDISFYDTAATLPIADSIEGLELQTSYDLNALLLEQGFTGGEIIWAAHVTGNGFSQINLVVSELLSDGSVVDSVFTIYNTPFKNGINRYDAKPDGFVSPLDALVIINTLNHLGARFLDADETLIYYYDVSGDNIISPLDALLVINELNRRSLSGQGEGLAEGEGVDSALMELLPELESGSGLVDIDFLDRSRLKQRRSFFSSVLCLAC